MRMLIIFDCDADLIDVPSFVVEQKEMLRIRFLKWIYGPAGKKYQTKSQDSTGETFVGVCYRADAFVEWLNHKVLKNSGGNATLVGQYIEDYPLEIPCIFL